MSDQPSASLLAMTPMNPAYQHDPHEILRPLRERCPVARDSQAGTFIVTGYAEGDGVGAGKSETGVLFKPFTLDALSSAVNRAVTRGKAPGIRKAAAVA